MGVLVHHHGHAVLVWVQGPAAMIVCLDGHAGGTVAELLELQAWVHQLILMSAMMSAMAKAEIRLRGPPR